MKVNFVIRGCMSKLYADVHIPPIVCDQVDLLLRDEEVMRGAKPYYIGLSDHLMYYVN